jgi:hypothetical protein
MKRATSSILEAEAITRRFDHLDLTFLLLSTAIAVVIGAKVYPKSSCKLKERSAAAA